MSFYLILFTLLIWIAIHSTVSAKYKWKISIASSIIYFISIFLFKNALTFLVVFYMTGVYFITMTIASVLQRNNYEEKKQSKLN